MPEPTDFQLEQLFDAAIEHGEFGRSFREHARLILRTTCLDPMCACRGGPCAECPDGDAVAEQEPDDWNCLESQFLGLMEGDGATEDHEDCRDLFRAAGFKPETVELLMVAIVNSDLHGADTLRLDWMDAEYACGDGYDNIDAALNDGISGRLRPAIDAAMQAELARRG